MDNWTDKKFSFLWEKLAYTHETDSFDINYSWVYMIGHLWLCEKKWLNGLALLSQRDINYPQYGRFPRNLKFSQPLTTRYEKNF